MISEWLDGVYKVLGKICRSGFHSPLPISLTLRHYFMFDQALPKSRDGALSVPSAWDTLRSSLGHFHLAEEREAWLASLDEFRDGQDPAVAQRAQDLSKLLRSRGIDDLHSVAVGAAALEYRLKCEMPSLKLTVSDFSRVTVDRLRRVFHECDRIELLDIATGDWSAIQPPYARNTAVLIYRADPCFSNDQWRGVFRRMAHCGIRQILFVPADFISFHYITVLQLRRWRALQTGRPITFTGYVRTDKAFQSLWRGVYTQELVVIGQMRGYWLTILRDPIVENPSAE
jgi:hypothetical protein